MPWHLAAGRAAETRARRYLERQGLRCLMKNYRCRAGELDLVMQDGATVVIVEVRYRRSPREATAAETVTRRKQLRIVRAALHLVQRHRELRDRPLRFDVVTLSGPLEQATLRWIAHAFCAADSGDAYGY
jgi:putative endonuclease